MENKIQNFYANSRSLNEVNFEKSSKLTNISLGDCDNKQKRTC